jgi:hypothetical protein
LYRIQSGTKNVSGPVEVVQFSDGSIVRGVFSESEAGLLLTLGADYPDVAAGLLFVRGGIEYGVMKRNGLVLTCEA